MEDPNTAPIPEVISDSPDNKGIDEISVVEGTSGAAAKSPNEVTDQDGTKTNSPEPNCAICLGKLENKSFTDSCFHTFCFVCLLEWSKVQAVCPLCKQPFKSIIHNVRSFEDYDQYHLRNEEQAMAELDSRRFRFHTTMTNERWWEQQRLEQERQMALLRRPSRITLATHWQRQRQAVTSGYRRRIYASDMRVVEVRSVSGRSMRYREITPEFFRSNPACMHRLVPWLNRELNVLMNQHEDHVQFVLELILDLVKRFSIQSEEFFQHIQPFTGTRTEHFIHEFHSFARSPHDMHSYDQRAVYNEPVEQPVHTIESSDDSSNQSNPNVVHIDNEDDDIIVVSPTEPSNFPADEATTSQDHPYSSMFASGSQNMDIPSSLRLLPVDFDLAPLFDRVQSFLSAMENRTTNASGWESPVLGTTMPSAHADAEPSTSAPTDAGEGTSGQVPAEQGPSASADAVDPQPTSSTLPPVTLKQEHDSDLDSDSSSVLVIGYEKPWDERSAVDVSTEDEREVKAALKAKKAEEAKEKRKLEKLKRQKKKKSRSRSRSKSHSRSRNCSRDRNRRSPPKSYRLSSKYRSQSRESRHNRRSKSRSISPQRREYSRHKRDRDQDRRRKDRVRHDEYGRRDRSRSRSHEVPSRYRDVDRCDDRDYVRNSSRNRDYMDKHRRRRSRSVSRSRSSPHRDSQHRKDSSIPRAYQITRSRSRSKSVEVVFRRSHKSKHKERRRHVREENSSSERERINLVSPSSRRSEHSSRSGHSNSSVHSPHRTTDAHHAQYKKNPTGHKKSTKNSMDRHHMEGSSRTSSERQSTRPPPEKSARREYAVRDMSVDESSRPGHSVHSRSDTSQSRSNRRFEDVSSRHNTGQVSRLEDISDSDDCEINSPTVQTNHGTGNRQTLDSNLTREELDEIEKIAYEVSRFKNRADQSSHRKN